MPPVKVPRILAGVMGAVLALFPIAPPEHMHEAEEHGHVHVVIHRHLKPHEVLEHHADDTASVDDDDGPILTPTAVYTVPLQQVIAGPERTVSALAEPPPPRLDERPLADVEPLIHGPPRAPTPSRAPPSPPAV